ncbi:hypothetical protein RI054_36g138730 [Pseudoscourfieldia marina]
MWSVTHTSTPSSASQRPDDDDPSKLANLLKLQASARGWLLRMRIRKSRADRRRASLLMPNINAQAAALALTAASGVTDTSTNGGFGKLATAKAKLRATWCATCPVQKLAFALKSFVDEMENGRIKQAQEVQRVSTHQSTNEGDNAMYTKQALKERRRCRADAEVGRIIYQWWDEFAGKNHVLLGCEMYCVMALALECVLTDSGGGGHFSEDMIKAACDDWMQDSSHGTHLNRGLFFDAIFELADLWTNTTSKSEYIAFLNVMLGKTREVLSDGSLSNRVRSVAKRVATEVLAGKHGAVRKNFDDRGRPIYDKHGQNITYLNIGSDGITHGDGRYFRDGQEIYLRADGSFKDEFGLVHISKDGHHLVDEYGRPLFDENGKPLRYGGPPPDDTPLRCGADGRFYDENGRALYDEYGRPLFDKDGAPLRYGGPPPDDTPLRCGADGRFYDENGRALYDEYGRPLFDKDGAPLRYGGPPPNDTPLRRGADGWFYDENGRALYDETGRALFDAYGRPLFDENGKPLRYGGPPPDDTPLRCGEDGRFYDENGRALYDEYGRPLFDENGKPLRYGGPPPNDMPLRCGADGRFYDENGRALYDEYGRPLFDKDGAPLRYGGPPPNDTPLRRGADGRFYDENGRALYDESGRPLFDENGRPISYGDERGGNPHSSRQHEWRSPYTGWRDPGAMGDVTWPGFLGPGHAERHGESRNLPWYDATGAGSLGKGGASHIGVAPGGSDGGRNRMFGGSGALRAGGGGDVTWPGFLGPGHAERHGESRNLPWYDATGAGSLSKGGASHIGVAQGGSDGGQSRMFGGSGALRAGGGGIQDSSPPLPKMTYRDLRVAQLAQDTKSRSPSPHRSRSPSPRNHRSRVRPAPLYVSSPSHSPLHSREDARSPTAELRQEEFNFSMELRRSHVCQTIENMLRGKYDEYARSITRFTARTSPDVSVARKVVSPFSRTPSQHMRARTELMLPTLTPKSPQRRSNSALAHYTL